MALQIQGRAETPPPKRPTNSGGDRRLPEAGRQDALALSDHGIHGICSIHGGHVRLRPTRPSISPLALTLLAAKCSRQNTGLETLWM